MGILKENSTMVINKRNRWNSFCELDQSMNKSIDLPNLGHTEINVIKGDFESLAENVKEYIAEHYRLCRPKGVYLCDGSAEEASELTEKMVERGMLTKLDKYENCLAARISAHR